MAEVVELNSIPVYCRGALRIESCKATSTARSERVKGIPLIPVARKTSGQACRYDEVRLAGGNMSKSGPGGRLVGK